MIANECAKIEQINAAEQNCLTFDDGDDGLLRRPAPFLDCCDEEAEDWEDFFLPTDLFLEDPESRWSFRASLKESRALLNSTGWKILKAEEPGMASKTK